MLGVNAQTVSIVPNSTCWVETNYGLLNTEKKTFKPKDPVYTHVVENVISVGNITDLRNITKGYLVDESVVNLYFDANNDMFKATPDTIMSLESGKSLSIDDYKFLAIDRHSTIGRKLIRDTNARFHVLANMLSLGAPADSFYEEKDESSDNFYLTKAVTPMHYWGSKSKATLFSDKFKANPKKAAQDAAKLYLMSNLSSLATNELTLNVKGVTHVTNL